MENELSSARIFIPDISLTITENNACPLYEDGDEFLLGGASLSMARKQPVCIILVEDMTRWFADGLPPGRVTFQCSGCSGRISLSLSRPFHADEGEEEQTGEIMRILRRMSVFDELSSQEREELAAGMRLGRHETGDILVRSGEIGRYLGIVIRGEVQILTREEIEIARLGAGQVFGEMSLFSGEVSREKIAVSRAATILRVSGRVFREFYNHHKSIRVFFSRNMARRLALNNEARIEEFTLGLVGQLSEMPPAEIFQTLHENEKTGVILFELAKGRAAAIFRDGELVDAKYGETKGVDAVFYMLAATKGWFKFRHGLMRKGDAEAAPLGDFMSLMMEGARRIDEA